jgi:outer membrane protein assembly factor BamB
MSIAARWFGLVSLFLPAGCDCSKCGGVPAPDDKPGAPAEKTEVTPVGPNSSPMLGGSINRNLANTIEKGIPDTWSIEKGKEKNIKWVAKLGTYAYGGPTIAGGRVFVGTNNDSPRDPAVKGDKGVLMCFRESDGKFLWQIVHDKNPEPFDPPQNGVFSTPVVDGNRLYYVSSRCELVCADVEGDPATGKGKIIWSLDMIKDLNVNPDGLSGGAANCSPLVIGDLVYAVTSNGSSAEHGNKPKNPKAPSLIAVDKKSGKVNWSDNSPGDRIMDGQWSNPVAAEANGEMLVIYAGGDGWLYAFEAKSGELHWKFDVNPKAAVFKPGGRGTRGYCVATPVVYDKKLYVAVGSNPEDGDGVGRLWCIDITKKPTNKDKDVSPFSAPDDKNPRFDPKDPKNKDSALVWHHGGLVVPKPKKDRELVFGRSLSTCAVHDGLVYGAEIAGFLQCLDAKTGQKYWSYDLQDATWNSPYYVDGKIFLGTDGSAMVVFPAGKTLKEPTKIDMDAVLKVPPVACNGVLYVTNGTHLYAIAAKK